MKHIRNRRGIAALPAVTGVALMLTLSLLVLFRAGHVHQDQGAKAQLRNDYHQREEALLRALVAVFPRKAIACMKAGHVASADYNWSTIFQQSLAMASSAETLPASVVTSLGLAGKRRGDTGDHDAGTVQTWITSLTGVSGSVTPGTTGFAGVFTGQFAGKVPPLLTLSQSDLADADALLPIVTPKKIYGTQHATLLADVTKYPLYNLIPYPNIRFGYAAPGEPFVAKRSWWAFTVKYGAPVGSQGQTGTSPVPAVEKHYVLSLYEIPSQLPIEGAAFAEIGRHKDGAAWNAAAISIAGGVYADKVSMNGDYGAERILGREGIQMSQALTLDGTTVDEDFDAPGVREQMQVDRQSDALPVALSANSGRLTFLPIQREGEFLKRITSASAWDDYSIGAVQCPVMVTARAMVSLADQTPTTIRVRFKKSNGAGIEQIDLVRGTNWPTILEPDGDAMPFQTELVGGSRSALTFHPSLFNAWLLANGGDSVETNHSVHFRTNPNADPLTVKATSEPPALDDMCVIIRKGKDLTSFTKGLAVVAPLRVYVGDDLNAIPTALPAGSGLPSGTEHYPPMAIFAAELRIGTTGWNRPVEHVGQIMTLRAGSTEAWQPLDLKSGSDDAVHTDSIAAELKPLKSPAELPPIHQMNWLVVVEEMTRQ
jgi:hypothetical protein